MTRALQETSDQQTLFRDISYTYYDNDWLATIYEELPSDWGLGPLGPGGEPHYLIEFEYDDRGRLVRETRGGQSGQHTRRSPLNQYL